MPSMLKILTPFVAALCVSFQVHAQNVFHTVIKDEHDRGTMPGVSVFIEALKLGGASDGNGQVMVANIPDGTFTIRFSFIGYAARTLEVSFPLSDPARVFEVYMEPAASELDEVVVQTTRTGRSIRDVPTRVEVIGSEELEEKSSMQPGNIRMLLNESTGIATQQTSAVSGTANIRIQGLDGRYTQILKDGLPLYGGFQGGLSIMQIQPLDLQQVEYIKGSASTLYGGGAIAGLVNLISKTPQDKTELTALLNANSARGRDASLFYAQKWKKVGLTCLGAYNGNDAYDPAGIGLSAIPKYDRFTLNPKLFLYFSERTTAWIGVNLTTEDRLGGDMRVIAGQADSTHRYFERNKTFRSSAQFAVSHRVNEEWLLQIKGSASFFDRSLGLADRDFQGDQVSSFLEANMSRKRGRSSLVAGLNLWNDVFRATYGTAEHRQYNTTEGAFVQHTYDINDRVALETGLRIDQNDPTPHSRPTGLFTLPRLNIVWRDKQHWTARAGGGFGYKMPSPFNETTEQDGYAGLESNDPHGIRAETSFGGNADVNFRAQLDEIFLSIDQLVFYTRLNDPLIGAMNADGHIATQGAETNVKIKFEEFAVYVGYTYTDTRQHFDGGDRQQPLTPAHRGNVVLTYEVPKSWRIGIEGIAVSEQTLNDGATGRGYVMLGALIEKQWKHLAVFLNGENLTDRRQSRWDTIYTGSITQPQFRDIYAPLEGLVVNGGVRIFL